MDRLLDSDRNVLKGALKKIDTNGFEAILFFVKDFTFKVKENFNNRIVTLRHQGSPNPESLAFKEFKEHE